MQDMNKQAITTGTRHTIKKGHNRRFTYCKTHFGLFSARVPI